MILCLASGHLNFSAPINELLLLHPFTPAQDGPKSMFFMAVDLRGETKYSINPDMTPFTSQEIRTDHPENPNSIAQGF